jgi:8-hydroxy-5-deazaflavin:NADPH oxidoreductase
VLPNGLLNKAKKETIVIDVGNYYSWRDGRIDEIESGLTGSAWVEKQFGWPVVKVLNSIGSKSLAGAGRLHGSGDRVALPISGDSRGHGWHSAQYQRYRRMFLRCLALQSFVS